MYMTDADLTSEFPGVAGAVLMSITDGDPKIEQIDTGIWKINHQICGALINRKVCTPITPDSRDYAVAVQLSSNLFGKRIGGRGHSSVALKGFLGGVCDSGNAYTILKAIYKDGFEHPEIAYGIFVSEFKPSRDLCLNQHPGQDPFDLEVRGHGRYVGELTHEVLLQKLRTDTSGLLSFRVVPVKRV